MCREKRKEARKMFIFIFIILGLVVYLSLSKASGFPVPGQKKDEAIDLLKRKIGRAHV